MSASQALHLLNHLPSSFPVSLCCGKIHMIFGIFLIFIIYLFNAFTQSLTIPYICKVSCSSTSTPPPYILPFSKEQFEQPASLSAIELSPLLILKICWYKTVTPSPATGTHPACGYHDSGGLTRVGSHRECVSLCDRPISVSTVASRFIPISAAVRSPSLLELNSAVCMAALLLLSFIHGHCSHF